MVPSNGPLAAPRLCQFLSPAPAENRRGPPKIGPTARPARSEEKGHVPGFMVPSHRTPLGGHRRSLRTRPTCRSNGSLAFRQGYPAGRAVGLAKADRRRRTSCTSFRHTCGATRCPTALSLKRDSSSAIPSKGPSFLRSSLRACRSRRAYNGPPRSPRRPTPSAPEDPMEAQDLQDGGEGLRILHRRIRGAAVGPCSAPKEKRSLPERGENDRKHAWLEAYRSVHPFSPATYFGTYWNNQLFPGGCGSETWENHGDIGKIGLVYDLPFMSFSPLRCL